MGKRALSEVHRVLRARGPEHERLRHRLTFAFLATLFMVGLGGTGFYFLERDAPRTDIHSLGDAFFFVCAQITTVSSSMTNPLTTGGRILDIVIELWAVAVVGTVIGSFGAFFVNKPATGDRSTGN